MNTSPAPEHAAPEHPAQPSTKAERRAKEAETKILSPRTGLAMFIFVLVAFFGTIEAVKSLFDVAPPDPLNGFILTERLIDLEEIERAIPLGNVRPLRDCEPIPAADALDLRHKFVVPSDRVAVLTLNGETRGYLLRVLVFHEVVNDVLGGVPIAVIHHPVSDLVVAYERTIGDEVLEFGTSGLLLDSHLLAYDLPPENDVERIAESSLWSPLAGYAIAGPRVGTDLSRLFCEVTTWGDFRTRFPEATIPLPPAKYLKQYRKDPYTQYIGSGKPRYRADPLPPEEGRSFFTPMLVVATEPLDEREPNDRSEAPGVTVEAYAIEDLIAESTGPTLLREQGGVALEFRIVDREKGIATVHAVREGELSWVAQTYWFTWVASEERIRVVAKGQ